MTSKPPVLRRGSKLGKYRLDKRLGKGAFATVWKARDSVEKRDVALKITHPELAVEHGRSALEHEARIATRLTHPNIVAVRNADWIQGYFVIATDLAVRNLAEYSAAKRSGPLALQIIRDVARGLAYAHDMKVLHRDVKPENILIFADRHAALCDFGVSRFARGATKTYTEAGTLGYMAPEQAYGRPKFTSDVFSLGLIAYETLTNVLPTWPFEWPAEGYARFNERVPEPLRPVLRKAAAFEPSQRYPDGVALFEAMEKAYANLENGNGRRRRVRRRSNGPSPSPLAVEAELFRRRFGSGLNMRFRCHRCDGAIAESMQYCPWCGSSDNSFREVTPYPLVCPDCERGVRAEWTACPWCYRGRLAGNGRRPRPDPKAERCCTRKGCDGQLQAFMRYCPVCKQKPKRAWSHVELGHRCPKCRWPVSKEYWRHCPWCGRREPKAGTFVHGRG